MSEEAVPTDSVRARAQSSTLPPQFAIVDTTFAEKFVTRHERTFEVQLADGEEFTPDVPNVSQDDVAALDALGLIRPGSSVRPGTILVGRVEPLDAGEASPEEKLLRAIFGETSDVRDVSLCAPAHCRGEVVESTMDGTAARVVVGWSRPLAVGDVLDVDGERVRVAGIETLDSDLAWQGGGQVDVAKVATARDTLHARSIGPYQVISQQPVEGRDEFGGQRLTQSQAQVLAAHAPWTLWEACTLKSDATAARTRAYESLVKGENPAAPEPRTAEAAEASESPADPAASAGGIFVFFQTTRPPGPGEAVCEMPGTVVVLQAHLQALGLDVPFRALSVRPTLLEAEEIRERSFGRVTNVPPSDADERLHDGLDSQKIFGPTADYECACGKYKRIKHRGVVCEECGVEVIQSRVRRERFGHIELAEPLRHPLLGSDARALRLLPVLPPDLRSAALQDAYRAVVDRNDRLAEAGESNGARTSLQAAVNQLFAALGGAVDELWKEVFSKPVDYSGVAHLVVDPTLDAGSCRVPRELLAELFKPWTYGALEASGYVTTIKSAKKMVEQQKPEAVAALRQVSEGYPLLLMADDRIVSREATMWDEPAIAVDAKTAAILDAEAVTVHVPVRHEAAWECTRLSDAPGPRRIVGGWLSRAIDAANFVEVAFDAAVGGEAENVQAPLLSLAMGRPPEPIASDELAKWVASRESIPCDVEVDDGEPDGSPPENPWLSRDVGELELSVSTSSALANAGLRTIADLCRRTESELLKTRGFGRESLREVKTILADLGLSLGMRLR